jgi:hypothetical protein
LQADILESVLFSDVVICQWRSQSVAVDVLSTDRKIALQLGMLMPAGMPPVANEMISSEVKSGRLNSGTVRNGTVQSDPVKRL